MIEPLKGIAPVSLLDSRPSKYFLYYRTLTMHILKKVYRMGPQKNVSLGKF